MTAKEKLVDIVKRAKGDNLERARYAFRGLSPKRLGQEYGQSGCTCASILAEYEHERAEWETAMALAISIPDHA